MKKLSLYVFLVLCQTDFSPDLELNSTCWDFKQNAKGGNMTIDWKKAYFVNSLEDYKKQREKKEGLKNLFLEKLEPKKSDEEMTQQLISILKKNGWKIKK